MRTLRRTQHEMRIELMPLIDVIFLLLTFFIFALMVMSPSLKMLSMETPDLENAATGEPGPAVTISLDEKGQLFVDLEPVTIDDVIPRLETALTENPDTTIFLATSKDGDSDRLPGFLALYNKLAYAGLNIVIVSNVRDEATDDVVIETE